MDIFNARHISIASHAGSSINNAQHRRRMNTLTCSELAKASSDLHTDPNLHCRDKVHTAAMVAKEHVVLRGIVGYKERPGMTICPVTEEAHPTGPTTMGTGEHCQSTLTKKTR